MDRLKEELRNLPHLPADRFRQTLRRDLQAAMQAPPHRGLKAALAGSSAMVVALGALLVAFVVSPDLPLNLHTAWLGAGAAQTVRPVGVAQPAGGSMVPAAGGDPALARVLRQANADASRDQEFLETWYSQRRRPTRIKAVSQERILAIRQFELASGEQVAVLTDLSAASREATRQVVPAVAAAETF